jgi:hypothetical protein
LRRLEAGNTAAYGCAFQMTADWLTRYPLRNNNWGPFFEDIADWSNTEINADTMAWYLLENPGWLPDSPRLARSILDWSLATFGAKDWSRVGVTAILEQTAYMAPGNSHTSRHASVELLYGDKTGDTILKDAAIRQLNWATYMVDADGKNRYPKDDIWLTDGYGDYLRHYLRAMAAAPELAPANQSHLLRSSSVLKTIEYQPGAIQYETFDAVSRDRLRVAFLPAAITVAGKEIPRVGRRRDLKGEDGYWFEETGAVKGWLEIAHSTKGPVMIRQAR